MKIFSKQTICLDGLNEEFEEECDLTICYSKGCPAGGGEWIPNGRGGHIKGPPLDPPEPADIELTDVNPTDWTVRWSKPMRDAITDYFRDADRLFEIVAEEEGY